MLKEVNNIGRGSEVEEENQDELIGERRGRGGKGGTAEG